MVDRMSPGARLAATMTVAIVGAASANARAAAPAFPGAVGYGAVATGGRGGRAVKVTSLGASGPGTLQAALDEQGPRIVVFEVSGVIQGDVRVSHGDVTIAGQSAPGAGLTIGGRLLGAYTTDVGNIVVRHLRIRPPPLTGPSEKGSQHDAVQFSRNSRVILDHVSASWASDETADFFEAKDLTLQDSTIEESSIEGHPEGLHNYGIIVGPDAARVSIVRTLVTHHFRRAPALGSGPVEVRNNVVYDVRDGFVHDNPAEGTFYVVGNVWKRGRSSRLVPFALEDEDPVSGDPRYVVRDNTIDDPGSFVGTVGDPFAERDLHPSFADLPHGVDTGRDETAPGIVYPARTTSAADAYREVLARAGAFPRDVVTLRTVEETRTRCGHWGAKPPPDLLAGLVVAAPPVDSDRDGIPDAWETSRGLSPTDPTDAARPLEGEYGALEVYLNELAEHLVEDAPPPLPDTEGPCPDVAPTFDEANGRRASAVGCSCDTSAPPPPLGAALSVLVVLSARLVLTSSRRQRPASSRR